MIIELSRIEGSSKVFEFRVRPEDLDLDMPSVTIKGDIQARVEVARHAAQTDVSGVITGSSEIECTRCLKPVERPIDIRFDVSFVTEENYTDSKETEVRDAELEVAVFEGEILDLGELVREQILLDLPEQIFCREDCKGLCPKCGVDRNLIDCNCDDDEIDPRWAALRNLK